MTDRETVRKYYTPTLKAWLGDLEDGKHDGGPEDPRIGVIKVNAKTATYAVSSKNILGRGYEVAKGTVTGQAASVNKLRELNEDELQECKSSLLFLAFHMVSSGTACVEYKLTECSFCRA